MGNQQTQGPLLRHQNPLRTRQQGRWGILVVLWSVWRDGDCWQGETWSDSLLPSRTCPATEEFLEGAGKKEERGRWEEEVQVQRFWRILHSQWKVRTLQDKEKERLLLNNYVIWIMLPSNYFDSNSNNNKLTNYKISYYSYMIDLQGV